MCDFVAEVDQQYTNTSFSADSHADDTVSGH